MILSYYDSVTARPPIRTVLWPCLNSRSRWRRRCPCRTRMHVMVTTYYRLRLSPLFVGEVEEDAPIVGAHGMFAFSQVVTEATADELAGRGRLCSDGNGNAVM